MNHRLDLINNIKDEAFEKMTEIRQKFIALDKELFELWGSPCFPEAQRAFSIARTHLETASMFAIKGICLTYEKKEKTE